ncbi:hypothetical protein EDB84DRAFT_176338 [Lactarius hengduanensis]|nr:hypothetical protein EDB84DRAFT_176338 [Lactarius hengduanensis]
MPAMIQPFEGGAYASTTDQVSIVAVFVFVSLETLTNLTLLQLQIDVSNQPTSAVNLDAPSGAAKTIWQGSLLDHAAVDVPNICFSTLYGISVAGAPLSPFISPRIGPSPHCYFPAPYMRPQVPRDHATEGGDRSTDMGTVPNVEGNEFPLSPPFENGQRTTNLSDGLTRDADTNTQGDERRSWNQPTGLFVAVVQASDSAPYKQVAVSRGRDTRVEKTAKKLYKCRPCDTEFSQSQGLSRHNRDKHEPRNPCRFCESFTWPRGRLYSYTKHLQNKHPGVATQHAQVTAMHKRKKRQRP